MKVDRERAPSQKNYNDYKINGKASTGALVIAPSVANNTILALSFGMLFSLSLDVIGVSLAANVITTFLIMTIIVTLIVRCALSKIHIRIDANTREVSYYRPKPKFQNKVSIDNFSINEPRAVILKVYDDGSKKLYIETKQNISHLILTNHDCLFTYTLAGKLREMLHVNIEVKHIRPAEGYMQNA
tara:strand:+ start:11240 stop:11797 length:558 start_codon:yes stop_codon:yes gene_type:complete